jgi:hypothetical protein
MLKSRWYCWYVSVDCSAVDRKRKNAVFLTCLMNEILKGVKEIILGVSITYLEEGNHWSFHIVCEEL